MKTTHSEIIEKVLQADSYRQFILATLGDQKKINFAELARKTEFSSRAYISDLMHGRKRMTANALPRFTSALKLTGPMNQLFQLMVLREEEHLPREKGLTKERIDSRILDLKRKIREKYMPVIQEELAIDSLSYEFFAVYAALGHIDTGSTLMDILKKTNLPVQTVNLLLEKMIQAQFALQKDDRYYATRNHLDLRNLGNNMGFKQAFIQAAELIARKAKNMENYPEDVFFHTAFAIKKEKAAEMRERLLDIINEYLDSELIDEGDSIHKITFAFHR